jgi:hypothetical protein
MTVLDSLKSKKMELGRIQAYLEQAKGRRDQILSQLKVEFDCSTAEEAQELLKGLKLELETLEGKGRDLDKEMQAVIDKARALKI